jgi:uncharacterized protein
VSVYLVAAGAVLLGGFLQGCIGFGIAMAAVPLMLLVMPAMDVVPLIAWISLANTSTMTWVLRRQVRPRMVLPLAAGCLIGVPIGVQILDAFDGPGLKAAIGALLVALSAVLFAGWSRPVRNEGAGLWSVGLLSGMMSGSTGIGGPPVVLFLSNQDTPRDVFRANIIAYFLLLCLISITVFTLRGAYDRESAGLLAVCIPAVLAGTWGGALLATRIPQELFRRITLLLSACNGLLLVIKNAPEWFAQ